MGMLNSVCLLIVCGIVILAVDGIRPGSVVPSAYASRVLTEVPPLPPNGGQFKIRASPSTPRRDHKWTVLVPPPPSVTEISYQSVTVTTNRTCGSFGSPPP